MVKLAAIVLLFALVCADASNFFEKDGCTCQKKTCDVASCSQMNNLCLAQSIKALVDSKSLAYPSSYLTKYLGFIADRAEDVVQCELYHDTTDYPACTNLAFTRFLYKYDTQLASISGKSGYDAYVADVQKFTTACANNDCKKAFTPCVVIENYEPFHLRACKKCVSDGLEKLISRLEDENAVLVLSQIVPFIGVYYSILPSAYKISDPAKREKSLKGAYEEIDQIVGDLYNDMVDGGVTPCTAASLRALVAQIVAACAYKK